MGKDIVIYLEETRDIIAIITDTSLGKESNQILTKGIALAEVDNTKRYILGDERTGDIKFIEPNNNIIYLDDYRRR